ncbi:DNA topoisomerase 2-binding protein 1 isoform X1 [Selaginella moellendorffii]|uniref:DNA topoisomerase 2-binding protein 1 isoform X1 n=1 Tax=Selaginella moellendorffii TaxID=88036 RepID=UPI000D1CD4C3|nr:DNA topoisomerase 2-binding protein 1 isoform X1 [Selaginella moellendorffii]XP_024530555.1 DNA topoisomerase 2-binding protein 1 isoform X1 [Selaginella moellendorffii]|eukprot:XP_024530554.1 DNA topoisomerase 2-binding protein 1 isoform X1 [Selaginella moellendorffii]
MALFAGAKLYLSRNLLPPDVIDSLHDILRQRGAQVNICCDPSAHSSLDFHVLFAPDSDKARSLQDKGCQILGPQCVFQCAKMSKPLPRRPCTCCLALEGIRVHATGFDDSKLKSKIEWLVTSMCGTLDASVSSSTDFVIAKGVSSPAYQVACQQKKPVVGLSWLDLCSREHQLVPHRPHKLSPLSGLNICATQVPVDVRVRIAEAANQNGASYSPNLTKECTHLIATSPDGEKFLASKTWGTIKVVNQDWLWQSLASQVCLDEDLFPVTVQARNDTSVVDDMPESISYQVVANQCHSGGLQVVQPLQGSGRTEADSYLANCRFYIVGFQPDDMKRLVDIVLDGGATRYIELNKTVTHIVLGSVSDSEVKSVQRATAGGAIQVVTSAWLEECAQTRQEIGVANTHVPSQMLPGSLRSDVLPQKPHRVQSLDISPATAVVLETVSAANSDMKEQKEKGVFFGVTFAFLEKSSCYEVIKKEIVEGIKAAGGAFEDACSKADYLIGFHGSPSPKLNVSIVSIHWLQQCLLEGKLLDTKGHVLYRPLPCRIPLPGFESFRLCISQYDDKDRTLCRHLCGLLGAKFNNTLTKKVTHLLCKAGDGDKFQAAVLLGIPAVTIEWLYACVGQNAVVSLEDYSVQAPPSGRSRIEGSQWVVTQKCRSEGICSGKRKSSNSRSSDTCKRPAACDEGGFDAWEVLTASWSTTGAESNRPDIAKHTQATPGGDAKDLFQLGVEIEDSMPSQPDVAAAIEHLLAQTGKAKWEGNLSGEEENEYDLLSEAAVRDKGSLLSENAKAGRFLEHEGDSNALSNGGDSGHEEFQIESQIVAYDEDHSGKQMIMERVRAGSTTNISCRKTKSSKSFALGRLFQAAEANK